MAFCLEQSWKSMLSKATPGGGGGEGKGKFGGEWRKRNKCAQPFKCICH